LNELFSKKKIFYTLIVAMTILAGIAIRTVVWLHSTCFWADEGCILSNLYSRNYAELFIPLSMYQCTPPMFLIFGKIFLSIFGTDHVALKFIPYIYSIATLIGFVILINKLVKNSVSKFFTIAFLAFHVEILDFTQCFKQYSSDVFFSILILLVILFIKDKKLTDKQWLCLGIFAIFCFVSSYTSVFIIGLSSIATVGLFLIKKDYEKLKSFAYYAIPAITGFVVFFFMNCLPSVKNEGLQLYWHTQEMFFPATLEQLQKILTFLIGQGTINAVIISILLLLGAYKLYKSDKYLFSVFSLITVNAFVLAFLNIYPLTPSRVSVYLVPFFLILLAKSADFECKKIFLFNIVVFLIFVNTISIKDSFYAIANIADNPKIFKRSNAKAYVESLYKTEVSKDDYIYVDMTSQIIFEIYDKEKRFSKEQIIYEVQFGTIEETLNTLPKGRNIFFFISNDYVFNNNYYRFSNWITEHCKIVNEADDDKEGYFIKCLKIR